MKSLFTALCCMLSLLSYGQKRAAIFKLDLKGNPYHLRSADIHVHVRQVIDRSQFLDSTGNLDREQYEAALAGKIDTNIAVNPEFAFSLRNLNTGSSYSISTYYRVQLDTISTAVFYRFRAIYQEVKVNSWTYEYRIPAFQPCNYDGTLHNRSCTKCHRNDKVLPIAYGSENEDEATGTPIRPTFRFYQSTDGSTDCDPNWYCERDRIRF